LAIKDTDIADYHYTLYNVIAALVSEHWPTEARERFTRLLREELGSEVHGEVDEGSWHLKQGLLRRQRTSAMKPSSSAITRGRRSRTR
jgi:hypothetical protein